MGSGASGRSRSRSSHARPPSPESHVSAIFPPTHHIYDSNEISWPPCTFLIVTSLPRGGKGSKRVALVRASKLITADAFVPLRAHHHRPPPPLAFTLSQRVQPCPPPPVPLLFVHAPLHPLLRRPRTCPPSSTRPPLLVPPVPRPNRTRCSMARLRLLSHLKLLVPNLMHSHRR